MVVVVAAPEEEEEEEEEDLIGEVSLGRWRERRDAMRIEFLLL